MSLAKYVKEVGCLSPRANVIDACREMRDRNFGCVLVISDDGKPMGVLTDRDVAMRVIAEGRLPDKTTLEEVMSGQVFAVPLDASIEQATALMRDHGVRRLPIIDAQGRAVGVISLDDVLLLLGMELGNLAGAIFTGLSTEGKEAALGGKTPLESTSPTPVS